jgi:Family of unknown function (DUF5309)
MAQTVITTATSANLVGKKPDVADVIFNMSPTKTPFQSLCKRGKTIAVTTEWQEDLLVNPTPAALVAEGAPAPASSGITTGMQSNFTQIFTKTVEVTGTADKIGLYGRKKEMAYQMAKKSAELKNEKERTLVNYCNTAAGTPLVTAPFLGTPVQSSVSPRGMKNFANLEAFSVLGDGTPAQSQDRTISSGGGLIISESMITLAHQKTWEKGGDPSLMMVDASTSVAIAGFTLIPGPAGTGTSGRFRDAGQGKKLVNVVDMYVSPFGELSVVLQRFFPAVLAADPEHMIFFIDPETLELAYLRNTESINIAKTGDFDKKQLIEECTLKVTGSDGNGILLDFVCA